MDIQPNPSVQPPGLPVTATSGLAISSLVFGILGLSCLFVLGGIPAIFCGHIAQSRIKRSGGTLKGRGIATAGLIMGYMSLAFFPIMLAIALPAFSTAKQEAEAAYQLQSARVVFTQILHHPESGGESGGANALFVEPDKYKTSTAYFDALVEQGVLTDYESLKNKDGKLAWCVVELDRKALPGTPFMISANINQTALDQPFNGRIKGDGKLKIPNVLVIRTNGVAEKLKRNAIQMQNLNPGGAGYKILHP